MARSGAATFCSFLELAERISTAAVRNGSTPQEAQYMETDYLTPESTNISTNRNVIGRWGDLGIVVSMPILAGCYSKTPCLYFYDYLTHAQLSLNFVS